MNNCSSLRATAAAKAYAPYSNFHVGCAIESRRWRGGDRREHGERLLPARPLRRAERADRRAAQVRPRQGRADRRGRRHATRPSARPCGGCRQAILEAAQLSGRDVEILCGSGDGSAVERHTIGELIPFGFGPANLEPPV